MIWCRICFFIYPLLRMQGKMMLQVCCQILQQYESDPLAMLGKRPDKYERRYKKVAPLRESIMAKQGGTRKQCLSDEISGMKIT